MKYRKHVPNDVILACRDIRHCKLSMVVGSVNFRLASTHWGRVTHICVSKITIFGSDNGLSPDRRQAIIWTNAGILLIGPLRTNLSEMFIEIHTVSFKKMHLKMSSAKWRLFYLGLNVLNEWKSCRWYPVISSRFQNINSGANVM